MDARFKPHLTCVHDCMRYDKPTVDVFGKSGVCEASLVVDCDEAVSSLYLTILSFSSSTTHIIYPSSVQSSHTHIPHFTIEALLCKPFYTYFYHPISASPCLYLALSSVFAAVLFFSLFFFSFSSPFSSPSPYFQSLYFSSP